jgi:hypothetical protein
VRTTGSKAFGPPSLVSAHMYRRRPVEKKGVVDSLSSKGRVASATGRRLNQSKHPSN